MMAYFNERIAPLNKELARTLKKHRLTQDEYADALFDEYYGVKQKKLKGKK